jgi:hypothetical protein
MSQAVSGHGATIAMELDPVNSQGDFTVIAELNGDINEPGLNRPWTETTPHQDTIDSGVTGRLGREPLTFGVNWIFDDVSHVALRDALIDNTFTGFRIRGPGGSAGNDEIIASGFVTNISVTNPVREGARSAEVTIQLSKAQIVDGVVVGTAV